MRRFVILALVIGLAASLLVAPASAGGKKKKVHETFAADLAPFPKLAAWGDEVGMTRPGCMAGVEGLNWTSVPFKAPGNGTLKFFSEGFAGDHDIYLFAADGETVLASGDQAQVPDGAPPEESIAFALKKGQKVILGACNWLGEPSVEAHYMGTFK